MIRKMKALLLVVCLCIFSSTIFPSLSLASDSSNDTVSVSDAKKMAIFQIALDMKSDKESPWKNKDVKIEEPIEIYDATDSFYGYLFNLTIDGKSAGFIETSALRDEYPILSFSYDESDLTPSKLAKYKNSDSVSEKAVILYPGCFGLKKDFSDGSAKICNDSETIELTKEQNIPKQKQKLEVNNDARELRKNIDVIVGSVGGEHINDPYYGVYDYDGVKIHENFADANLDNVLGVPDLNQIYSSLWTGPSGCAPTSAANIMKYWATEGYPQLTQGLSDEQLLYQLRVEMGTYFNGINGITPVNNISPGMQDFARSKGVSAALAMYYDPPTWTRYKHPIKYHDAPLIVAFTGSLFYGEHAVTGYGYKEFIYNGSTVGHRYMRVRDNDPTTPSSTYVHYSDTTNDPHYIGLYLDAFFPDGDY